MRDPAAGGGINEGGAPALRATPPSAGPARACSFGGMPQSARRAWTEDREPQRRPPAAARQCAPSRSRRLRRRAWMISSATMTPMLNTTTIATDSQSPMAAP